jgi:hypothetical protein
MSEAAIDAHITSRIQAVGLGKYIEKTIKDADHVVLLPQDTGEQADHKVQMILGTIEYIGRLLTREDVAKLPSAAVLNAKLADLSGAIGIQVTAPAAGGRRKTRRRSTRKTRAQRR